MRSSLRIDPWNDLSCVTFSGSALSTLPKVHNHVRKKGLGCSSCGRFVEVRNRECSIATKAVGSGITGGATLDAPLPSAVPVLTLGARWVWRPFDAGQPLLDDLRVADFL